MVRLLPLPLCLALAACATGPLSVIPPADMALLAADSRTVPASPAVMPGIGPLPAGLDPVALSFHAALCADGAQPVPEGAEMGCGTFPGATLPEAPEPIAAPAAISVADMLARVRGGDVDGDGDG